MAQLSVLWSTPLAAGLVVLGAIGLAVAAVCPSVLVKGRHQSFGLGGGGSVGSRDDEEGLGKVCSFTILDVCLSSEFAHGRQLGKCYCAKSEGRSSLKKMRTMLKGICYGTY